MKTIIFLISALLAYGSDHSTPPQTAQQNDSAPSSTTVNPTVASYDDAKEYLFISEDNETSKVTYHMLVPKEMVNSTEFTPYEKAVLDLFDPKNKALNDTKNINYLKFSNFFYISHIKKRFLEEIEKSDFKTLCIWCVAILMSGMLVSYAFIETYSNCKKRSIIREALAKNCPLEEITNGVMFNFMGFTLYFSLRGLREEVREEQLKTVLFYLNCLSSNAKFETQKKNNQIFIKGHWVPLELLQALGYKKADDTLPVLLPYIKLNQILHSKNHDKVTNSVNLIHHHKFRSERLDFFQRKGSCWELAQKDRKNAHSRTPSVEDVEKIKKNKPTMCFGLMYKDTMELYSDFMNS